MSAGDGVALAVGVALLVYLIWTLLFPENF